MKRLHFKPADSSWRWPMLLSILVSSVLLTAGSCRRPSSNDDSSSTSRTLSTEREPQATTPTASDPDASLRMAIDHLFDQQGEDGGWHSPAYGSLRPGAAVTALVLYALSHAAEWLDDDQKAAMRRGLEFLEPGIDAKGYVVNPDGGPDFTNYATAMVILANDRLDLGLTDERRRKLLSYLVRSQLGEAHEYESGNADYGGWDLSGWMIGPRRSTGTNISVSSLCIEALSKHADELPEIAECLVRADRWLDGCQNLPGDGGFFFHPDRSHDGNKAGWPDESRATARSYGSCTADGLRAIRVFDASKPTDRRRSAIEWLVSNAGTDKVPGFEHQPSDLGWEQGLRYYYYFSLSAVIDLLGDERSTEIRAGIIERLMTDQLGDGRWENPVARMREDDPLIATSFAVAALSRLITPSSGEE